MTKNERKLVVALAWMYIQYCPLPYTHMHMNAGEDSDKLLAGYGLIKPDGSVDEVKLVELERHA
jgi:hypothetical protein